FGGFLIWNVGDCWPQQSDSVMDYAGTPKRVFERLGQMFQRVRNRHAARIHGRRPQPRRSGEGP
ncbi:MAG: hypothetical protein AMJ81_13205, partial [Phycisphaerae bacterium SM23_33]